MDTDIMGLADSRLVFVGSTQTPRAKTNVDATDSNGDVAARSYIGTTTVDDVECRYALTSGTLDLSTVPLGPIGGAVVRTALTVETTGDGWPQVTSTGISGAVDTDSMPTFSPPAISVSGTKRAQALGFTKAAGCRLTGSSFEASVELAEQTDSQANICAMGLSGGNLDVSADLVEVTTAASATADTTYGLTIVQDAGQDKAPDKYGTTTVRFNRTLVRDT